jgi:hypothetical protein
VSPQDDLSDGRSARHPQPEEKVHDLSAYRRHMANHPVRPVKVSARIPVPPDLLFAFVSDTRNDPLWCSNVETVDLVDGSGIEAGARFRFHQHLDRPRSDTIEFDVDVEIVEMSDHSITWRARDKFQDRNIRLIVEPDSAGSKITQITEASFQRPPGLAKWAYPLLARRIFKEQFEQLEAYFLAKGSSDREYPNPGDR